jgi:ribonuclease BN (tRNA processing enzyme)
MWLYPSFVSNQWPPKLSWSFLIGVAAVLAAFVAPLQAAQDPPAHIAPKGDELILLGTHGGPSLEEERSQPASLLVVDRRPYLIDCGVGTMRRMLDARVPSETIAAIFITHDHPDHALGLADVMSNDLLAVDFGLRDSPSKFHIYGPPPTKELVNAAYDYIRISFRIFAAEQLGASTLDNPFLTQEIDRDGLVYQDGKIRVTAAENTHFQLMPAKYRARMKSYAYRFDTPYGAIVFTGDTGPSEALEKLAKGADVLVSEVEDLGAATSALRTGPEADRRPVGNANALAEHMQKEHLPVKSLGETASKARVKSVVLHHLLGQEPGEELAAGVKQYYSGPVFAGADLKRYCLGPAVERAGDGQVLTPCN